MSKPIREPGPAAPQLRQSVRAQQTEADRRRREAEALRENLAKRKAQQRLRRPPATAGGSTVEGEAMAGAGGGPESRE